MSRALRKFPQARAVALAVGAGVLGTFAFTGTSLATAPAAGTACQAADGKINGRGATFQTKAQVALIAGYTSDVCGPVASDAIAGTNMVVYNYPAAAANAGTGSGAGQKAASCRTDAFAGTDIPYDQATLNLINGAPGATGGCGIAFTPPFTPNAAPWPAASDVAKPVMSFPVAGSSVAIGVNLPSCPNVTGPLNLTSSVLTKLEGGQIAQWNDPALLADNASLAGCTTAVTRVVRFDKSGTTQTYKNYLKNADPSSAQCDGTNWLALSADAANQTWPNGTGCATLSRPTVNGGGAVVALVNATDGAFGYADLADWTGAAKLANLDNANPANTTFVSPQAGSAANCSFAAAVAPGSSANDAVGLNGSGANWASDAPTVRSDVTYLGDGYPICGFTFDFVFTKLNNGTVGSTPITGLTNNQRRSLYSYFTYVLSPNAQARLNQAQYAALPTTLLSKLRQGFQVNF